MNKLLHERLREVALRGGYLNCVRTLIGKEECPNGDCRDCVKQAAKTLADEIEKYYIPRPRFEDGEPVQFGDDIEIYNLTGLLDSGTIQSFHPNNGSVWMLSLVGANHERLVRFDPGTCVIKRPESKVLDADGVEIKVGETVWPIDDPEMKMTVDNFQRIYGQNVTVNCEFEGEFYNFNPDKLTHREPDSLEKLQRDMSSAIKSVKGQLFECDRHINMSTVEKWSERLTAIMERDA